MAYTGNNQAVIAYKVRNTDGAPLDINGEPTGDSGRKQAIMLLDGAGNPNPAIYEIEGYFTAESFVTGNTTIAYDTEKCPVGLIFVNPSRLVLSPNSEGVEVSIYSESAWTLIGGNMALVNILPTSGGAGFSFITVTPNAIEGQSDYIFQNTETGVTATLKVILSADTNIWILATGNWNNLGFWFDNEIWNY